MKFMIPFTTEQFLEVFAAYNRAIFPMQLILVCLAVASVFFAAKPNQISSRIVSIILTFFWAWMGIVYHLIFFSRINKLAYLFGGLFLAQALIFFTFGVVRDDLCFGAVPNSGSKIGAFIITYSLLIYPTLNYLLGHNYPAMPTFGVPCPTTIFTFGLLLWTNRKVPIFFLMIPIAWSLVSIAAVFKLGIYEDIGLVITGIFGPILIAWRD